MRYSAMPSSKLSRSPRSTLLENGLQARIVNDGLQLHRVYTLRADRKTSAVQNRKNNTLT